MDQAGDDDLSCRELVELVTDYLENALVPDDHARFEAHLADCTGCRHYVAQMRRTIQLTGRLREDDVSPDAQRELLRQFRDWKRRSAR